MTDIVTDGTRLILPGGVVVPCAMGRSGLIDAARKREGDGATPIGRWRLVRVYFRPDRVDPPRCRLPVTPLSEQDGWCDAPHDPAYNRHVLRPYPASHEAMWRADGLYDIVVTTDHNSDPVVRNAGSAIFLHCRNPEGKPTAGCIALDRPVLQDLLGAVAEEAYLDIRAAL